MCKAIAEPGNCAGKMGLALGGWGGCHGIARIAGIASSDASRWPRTSSWRSARRCSLKQTGAVEGCRRMLKG